MRKNILNLSSRTNPNTEKGFSLIESAIALTIMGFVLAYAAPVFLFSKLNNAKSEIRTGALAVTQKILDQNRGKPFSTIATTGSEEIPEESGGREYIAKVFYCQAITGADACDANYKRLNIEIKDKKTDSIVYEVETGLTNFQ